MRRSRRLIVLLVPLLLVWQAPPAHARLVAKPSLVTKSGATKIVLKLSSTTPVTRQTRPRAVKVLGGGEAYPLERVTSVATTRTRLGTWKSAAYRGAAETTLLALAGQTVTIKVRSRAGTTTLRSKLAAPSGSTDITGQQAIDQMTGYLNGAAARFITSSGDTTETWELHLCTDGKFRVYRHQNFGSSGFAVVEKFGQPWTVVEALIKGDGSYGGARLQGTFTTQNSGSGGFSQINEPVETIVEFQNDQWYWEGQPVETFQASCNPSF